MGNKTLYVTDLDGTLLTPDEQLTAFTMGALNDLVDGGLYFAYATARSFVTASKVTAGLNARLPAIVYNGALIVDSATHKLLLSNYFAADEVAVIREALTQADVYPIVYAYIAGVEKFSSYRPSAGVRGFLDTRKGDIRANPVDSIDALYSGDIFYFACIDTDAQLEPLYHALKDRYSCIYHRDVYTHERWLEIMPRGVSKANAILQLKDYLQCDSIIAFGDGMNDVAMFQIADECYAVENALDALKKIATGVIGSNTDDGVARWLLEHARR